MTFLRKMTPSSFPSLASSSPARLGVGAAGIAEREATPGRENGILVADVARPARVGTARLTSDRISGDRERLWRPWPVLPRAETGIPAQRRAIVSRIVSFSAIGRWRQTWRLP